MGNNIKLTDRELSIMHVFWERGEATIAQVHEELNRLGNELAYTSVATIVRILEEKEIIERTKDKRPFLYRALYDFEHVSGNIVEDLVDRLFGGSRRKLMVQLAEKEKLSKKELAALKKLLSEDSK